MERRECRVGMKVLFGRPSGEKTLGVIEKVNPAKAQVRTLESRGSRHGAGVIWKVPYSLMQEANDAGEPVAEKILPLEFSPMVPIYDQLIIEAINCVYGELSPENLAADGERPSWAVQTLRAELTKKLNGLQAALGRKVSEEQVGTFIRNRCEWLRRV